MQSKPYATVITDIRTLLFRMQHNPVSSVITASERVKY